MSCDRINAHSIISPTRASDLSGQGNASLTGLMTVIDVASSAQRSGDIAGVKGHWFLPTGGQESCPLTATELPGMVLGLVVVGHVSGVTP